MCREGRFTVIRENLDRALIRKDAKLLKRPVKRHLEHLTDIFIEPLVHAGPVDDSRLPCIVIMDRQSAAAVRLREEVEIRIPAFHSRFHLEHGRKRSVRSDLFDSQLFYAFDRSLYKLAVHETELSRQAHAAFPLVRLRRIVIIRKSDPGNEDGLIRIFHIGCELRRIEVKTEVKILIIRLRRKGQRVVIHLSYDIDIVVRALRAAGQFRILRREDQDVLSADVDDARAFPHAAKVLESRNIELAGEFPSGKQV